jgi:hypothetical protein
VDDPGLEIEAGNPEASFFQEDFDVFQTETVEMARVVIEIFLASQPVYQAGFDGQAEDEQALRL